MSYFPKSTIEGMEGQGLVWAVCTQPPTVVPGGEPHVLLQGVEPYLTGREGTW